MQIVPDTLKTLRQKRGISQHVLATEAKIAKRTIARLESNKPPKNVRKVTVDRLADFLKVQPETLGKPINAMSDEEWKERGYTSIKVRLQDEVRVNYHFAMHHYGIGLMDLINAAPWMFTLLAEMSLAQRQKKVSEYKEAFQDAMSLLPSHLNHGTDSHTGSEWAVGDENDSIAARDVFGTVILNSQNGRSDPFDPDDTNPFHAFVKELADQLDTSAIDPALIEWPNANGMPHWPLFQEWLEDLTGGDSWAKFAVENIKIGLSDMPEEIKGPDKTPERIDWLISKIPPERRAREEQRHAEWDAVFGDIQP